MTIYTPKRTGPPLERCQARLRSSSPCPPSPDSERELDRLGLERRGHGRRIRDSCGRPRAQKRRREELVRSAMRCEAKLTPYAGRTGHVCGEKSDCGGIGRRCPEGRRRGMETECAASSYISYRLAQIQDAGKVALSLGIRPRLCSPTTGSLSRPTPPRLGSMSAPRRKRRRHAHRSISTMKSNSTQTT